MPIPAGTTTSPPPVVVTPPPVTPVVSGPPWAPVLTAPTVTLVGASGRRLSLTGTGYDGVSLSGPTGVGLAPPELFKASVADGDGSVFLGARTGDREVFLPLLIGGTDYTTLRANRRALERVVTDGPVRVTVQQPDDGTTRTVEGYYAGGLEGDYGVTASGYDWQVVGVVLKCLDPLAYGDLAVQTWSVTGVARPFLSTTEPFFPVILGDSLVGGERVLRNAGDTLAWPVTTVTGPGSGLVLDNLTTGKSFALSGAITAPVTIDSRRVVADVFDAAGDLWDRVVLGSSLWPLVPGENRVRVTLAGATSGSSVQVSWAPPYRSLH